MKTSFSILLLLLALAPFYLLIAQNKIWTGAIDSSWHTAGNWNLLVFPDPVNLLF